MIFTHLKQSWPKVLAGEETAEDATRRAWALVADVAIERYGDVVCGVYNGQVMTALDITGWSRDAEGRVWFDVAPSAQWAHLVGDTSPVAWTRGQARPVRYLDTEALRSGTVEPEQSDDGTRRAVIGDYVLTVDPDGAATLLIPPGASVAVTSRAA